MTLANMQLEDMLAILGRVGTVTLRKGTNDVSATPGHTANTAGWVCEITIAGYHNCGYSQSRMGAWGCPPGLTATEAARHTLAEVEAFLSGPKGKEERARYVSGYELRVAVVGKTSDTFRNTYTHPGPIIPEARLDWSD